MATGLLVNVMLSETRLAYIDADILQEIHIEREAKRNLLGNIYKARVIRVLPGIQSAFVDIGLDKAAFLPGADIVHRFNHLERKENIGAIPDISTQVHVGQELIVQVLKEPLGMKGMRVTTDIRLPSRYLVFMPNSTQLCVSQRIQDDKERERLKAIISSCCAEKEGFIIRTAAEGVREKKLFQEVTFLRRLWEKVLERKASSSGSSCLHAEFSLAECMIRDLAGTHLDFIRVDSFKVYRELLEFASEYMPEMTSRIQYHKEKTPIFERYDIEKGIQCTLDARVELKSGGYLLIEQTEAMVTIDVNTGSFVGGRSAENTILNTNMEAVYVISRELRRRNLGGIIVVDFIDMSNEAHRQQILSTLEASLNKDRVKTTMSGFTSLGLVEVTRKRTRESLERVLCQSCPTCKGQGSFKTIETLCYEIIREIARLTHASGAEKFLVYLFLTMGEPLKNAVLSALPDLNIFVGKPLNVRVETCQMQTPFEVIQL